MSNLFQVELLKNFFMSLREDGSFAESFGSMITIYSHGIPKSNVSTPWDFTFKGRGLISSSLSIKNIMVLDYIIENHENDFISIRPNGHNGCVVMVFRGIKCVYEARMKIFDRIKRV